MKIRLERGGKMGVAGRARDGENEPPFGPSLQPPPLRSPRKRKREKEEKKTVHGGQRKEKEPTSSKEKDFLFLSLGKCSALKVSHDKLAAPAEKEPSDAKFMVQPLSATCNSFRPNQASVRLRPLVYFGLCTADAHQGGPSMPR